MLSNEVVKGKSSVIVAAVVGAAKSCRGSMSLNGSGLSRGESDGKWFEYMGNPPPSLITESSEDEVAHGAEMCESCSFTPPCDDRSRWSGIESRVLRRRAFSVRFERRIRRVYLFFSERDARETRKLSAMNFQLCPCICTRRSRYSSYSDLVIRSLVPTTIQTASSM